MEYSKTYNINSANRVSGTSSNFQFLFDVETRPYNYAVVQSLAIPKSYYCIRTNHNAFILRENGVDITINLDVGNFGISAFLLSLNSLMSLFSLNGVTYTATFNYQLGKILFQKSATAFPVSIVLVNGDLHFQLGFVINSTNTYFLTKLLSTNVIDMSPPNTLYLRSDLCATNQNNILVELYASNVSPFSYIPYQSNDLLRYSKLISSNQNLHTFQLTTTEGEILDLNGLDMSINLLIFKKETDYLKEYFKLQYNDLEN